MIQDAHVGFLHVPIKIGTSTKISPKSKPYSENFSRRNNSINPLIRHFFLYDVNTHLNRIMNLRTTPTVVYIYIYIYILYRF